MNLAKDKKTVSRTIQLGIAGSAFLAIVKFCTGYYGNSYALVADAIESTTDIFASLLLLVGLNYSRKPADENHPYGHGRAEALLTFAVVVFLVVAAGIIGVKSVINIRTPHALPKTYTLYVLLVIIAVKEILYRITSKKSKEGNSVVLHAEAWHHRSDAITSLLALLGISIALLFGKGFEIADDIAALLASIFILYNAYLIFRPALGEIMDEHTHQEVEKEVRSRSLEVIGVLNTEKCYIRKIGPNYIIDLHIVVNGKLTVEEGHTISHNVKDHLMETIPFVGNVNIHVEPEKVT